MPRRWRRAHASAPDRVLDPDAHLPRSGASVSMPTRTITRRRDGAGRSCPPDASRSTTATSSRCSSSRGTGAGSRGARHALFAARHALARAVARRDERRRRSRVCSSYSQPSDTSPEAGYTLVTRAGGATHARSSICTCTRRRRTGRARPRKSCAPPSVPALVAIALTDHDTVAASRRPPRSARSSGSAS